MDHRVGFARLRANWSLNTVVLTAITTLVAVLMTGMYLDYRRDQQKTETLNQLLATHCVAWRAAQNQYGITVQTYYEELLDNAALVDHLGDATEAEKRVTARVELYRTLFPQYETLSARGIRTLRIILPDEQVLLRFHRPDRYGDRVNIPENGTAGSPWGSTGNRFRVGGTVSGFRYLFPVKSAGDAGGTERSDTVTPLGYVELGIPFESVRRELARLLPEREFQLLLHRDIVEEVVFEDQQRLYGPWPGSDEFSIEDPYGILPGSAPPLSRQSQAVVAAATKDSAVQNALRSHSSSAIPVVLGGQSYALVLIAVHDTEDRHVGFVASYAPEPALDTADTTFRIAFALSTAVLILFAVTAHWLVRIVAQRLSERRRLRTIHDTLGEGLYVMDRSGTITELNGRVGELLGYDQNELLGHGAHTVFHSHRGNENASLSACPIFRATLSGTEFSGEEVFRHRDGKLVPVHVVSRPIVENGEVTGSVTSFSDLSDQKRTLTRLRTLSLAVEQSPESIVITDRTGRIEYVNRAFEDTTGYGKTDALGRNPRFLSSGKTERQVFMDMWGKLSAGKSWYGELINRRKDGTEYVEEAILAPIVGERGETVGFLGIKQDITGRKQDERELKRRLEEKEILLREVHHRVRNNLNIIVSLLNLQSADISSPETAMAAFEKSRDRVMSMALVHNVLNRSSDVSVLDAEDYVGELTGYLRQVYDVGPGVTVDYSICSTCLAREIAVPCGLILTELISNAFLHAFPGGREGTVTIGLEPVLSDARMETDNHRLIRLSVTDSGIGSDAPFNESATLGLVLVRMLTEQISGNLTIDTTRGTTVAIEFPG
jgi:PAS domain S-box-containing protein